MISHSPWAPLGCQGHRLYSYRLLPSDLRALRLSSSVTRVCLEMEVNFTVPRLGEGKHELVSPGSEDFPRTLGNSSESPAQVDSCFQPQPATSVTSGPLLALSEPWFCPVYNGMTESSLGPLAAGAFYGSVLLSVLRFSSC